MLAPCLTLTHLKTSKQYEGASLINRYWFEWSKRRELSNLIVRLELLDATGLIVTTTSIRLPKVKITGYSPATETEPGKPIYNSTLWVHIDDVVLEPAPTHFRYSTIVGFARKSEVVTAAMDGKYEDISQLG
ncbi:hypothetical protein [Spirosoma arcticum]